MFYAPLQRVALWPARTIIQALCVLLVCGSALSGQGIAAQPDPPAAALSAAGIIDLVHQATAALNNVARSGATKAQAEQLFALYSADFVYVHQKYGGTYSRDQLYRNTLRMIENGGDQLSTDRYQLVHILPAASAAAVLRLTRDGQQHLALFEFSQGKISKITEYW